LGPKKVAGNRLAAEGLEGQRRNEVSGLRRHRHAYLGAGPGKQDRRLSRLVGGDATADTEQHAAPRKRSPGEVVVHVLSLPRRSWIKSKTSRAARSRSSFTTTASYWSEYP